MFACILKTGYNNNELAHVTTDGPNSGYWAFGCSARHPFLLQAMRLLAERVTALQLRGTKPDDFKAKIATAEGPIWVDVLHTTGPGMVGHALQSFSLATGDTASAGWGRNFVKLQQVRERFGEDTI